MMIGVMSLQSCVKKDYDVPEDKSGYDPMLTVTHSIKDIQDLASGTLIEEDVIIAGIVNFDDREGNYYKKIAIQDETGGIEILLDQNNLYNDYPVGRKVYVKLKGLYKGDYNANPQIGYVPDGGGSLSNIPFTLIDQHMVKANYPNTITPEVVTLADISSPNAVKHLLNTLVEINDVEFTPELIGLSFANPASMSSATNRNLQECGSSTKIVVRTSGYAKFQPATIPGGRGKIIALYTRFGNTPQLYIRSTNDVQFDQLRCDGSSPTGPELITIDSLRKRFTGTTQPLSGIKITGTVISDRANGNMQSRNLVIQQGDKGIMIRFSGDHIYNLNDSITVTLGGSLEEYNGLLQVNGVDLGFASKVGSGSVAPKVITLADLNAAFESYESTLVKVMNASITTSGSYSGNKTLSDGTGTITLYTASGASFKNEEVSLDPKNYTGIVGQFSATRQLQMRSLADVE